MRQNMGMRLDSVDDLRAPAIQMIAHPDTQMVLSGTHVFIFCSRTILPISTLSNRLPPGLLSSRTIISLTSPNDSTRSWNFLESPGSIWPLMLMSLILM